MISRQSKVVKYNINSFLPSKIRDWNNLPLEIIRIYRECEGMIEKSVPRIAVWHHEACRVMTNGDPEVMEVVKSANVLDK